MTRCLRLECAEERVCRIEVGTELVKSPFLRKTCPRFLVSCASEEKGEKGDGPRRRATTVR